MKVLIKSKIKISRQHKNLFYLQKKKYKQLNLSRYKNINGSNTRIKQARTIWNSPNTLPPLETNPANGISFIYSLMNLHITVTIQVKYKYRPVLKKMIFKKCRQWYVKFGTKESELIEPHCFAKTWFYISHWCISKIL